MDENALYISFRGTSSVDDISDDMNFRKTRINLPNHMDLDRVFLHTGFVEQFMSLQSALQHDLLRSIRSRPQIKYLHFLGHSKGGSVSQVAALYFGSLLAPTTSLTVSCTALGSPKFGYGRDFDEAFRLCVPDTLNLTNDDDIIPSLPFFLDRPVTSYAMRKGKLYLKSNRRIAANIVETLQCGFGHAKKGLKTWEDHRLDSYMASITSIYGDEK